MRGTPSDTLCIFFNDTATTEIYTLALHDALPIWPWRPGLGFRRASRLPGTRGRIADAWGDLRCGGANEDTGRGDRKSTRLNSSHANISYAVFCLKKKTRQ